ncbi:hypothetical protein FisN_19Hu289 [Fistulifera solaris]|uniref:Secreted protein n=1 Tax=Fistulifera solaris TaxID=1519565 RepID=A0A1Z5K073_FISSO|nr:hypothetical protein FisN_19Hu289 [Fistulifera solaris]|eukprot:GAX19703.1 hypothetical protein FisN_19Hu289 [Fistulifera solaris]
MQIQHLPLLLVFSLAFAARGVCAEDTFHWTWCELLPFLWFCDDDAPEDPCPGRRLRQGRFFGGKKNERVECRPGRALN